MKRFSDFPISGVCFLMKQTCYKLSLQNKASVPAHLLPHTLAHRDGYSQENRILVPRDSQCFIQKGHQVRPHLIPAFPKLWVTATKTWWIQPGSQRLPSFLHPSPANSGSSVHQPLGPEPQGLDCFFPSLYLGHRFHAREESQENWWGERERNQNHTKGLPTVSNFLMKRCHPERNRPLSLPAALTVSPRMQVAQRSLKLSVHGRRSLGLLQKTAGILW